jgi:hypothetical protein
MVNSKDFTNRVRYSLDFGQTWQVLRFLPSGQQVVRGDERGPPA